MRASSSRGQPSFPHPVGPLLIVLSGPSGVGKDAVLAKMRESGYPLRYITTATTRPQRPTERDGLDYHFVSTGQFQDMIENNELIEHANVYGNWYGIPKADVRQALKRGEDVMVKIDVQGAATVKRIVPRAVFIFLMPPSVDDLYRRLKQRHTESSAALALRVKTAEEEMKQLPLFDYVVVNEEGRVEQAVADIKAIITAEKCRVKPRDISL